MKPLNTTLPTSQSLLPTLGIDEQHSNTDQNNITLPYFEVSKNSKQLKHQIEQTKTIKITEDNHNIAIEYLKKQSGIIECTIYFPRTRSILPREALEICELFQERITSLKWELLTENPDFVKVISKLQNLKSLSIMREIRFEHIEEIINNMPCLIKLKLININIDAEEVKLAKAIATLKHLEVLDLSGCNIGYVVVKAIATMPCLKALHLSGCNIGYVGVKAIATMQCLEILNLSWNKKICDLSAKIISTMPCLKALDLSGCNIGYVGVTAIATIPCLTELNLASNMIEYKMAKIISAMPCLTKLDLSHNNIGIEGVIEILQAKAFSNLNLSWNYLELSAELMEPEASKLYMIKYARNLGINEDCLTTLVANLNHAVI